jgi:hypothetical protein
LRAEVHRLNGEFADDMRDNSPKRKIVGFEDFDGDDIEGSDTSSISEECSNGQILVSKRDFDDWVKQVWLYSIFSTDANARRFIYEREARSSQGTIITFFSRSSSMSSPVDGANLRPIMWPVCLTRPKILLNKHYYMWLLSIRSGRKYYSSLSPDLRLAG